LSIYDDLIEAGLQVPEGDEGLSDFRPPADLYETLERQGQASFDEIGRRFNTKLSGWIEYLFTVGLGSGPVTPERAREKTAALLEKAFGLGLGAHLTAMGLEAAWPGKQLGAGQLAGLFAAGAGFGPIMGSIYNAAIAAGFGIPYRKYWMREYRPNDLSLGDARDLFYQGWVPMDQLRAMLEYGGIPELKVEQFLSGVFRTPGSGDIMRILRESDYSGRGLQVTGPDGRSVSTLGAEGLRPWAFRKLQDGGYSPEDAGALTEAAVRSAASFPRRGYITAMGVLYAGGRMDFGVYESRLRATGLSEEVLLFYMERARLQKEARDADLILEAARKQFRKEILSQADLEGLMRSLGVEARTAAHMVAADVGERGIRAATEAEAEERARKAAIAQLSFEALERGLIGIGQHEAQLIGAGYPAAVAEVMAERDALRVLPAVKLPVVKSQSAAEQEAYGILKAAALRTISQGEGDPALVLSTLLALGEFAAIASAEVDAAVVTRELRLARERKVEEESAGAKAARAEALAKARAESEAEEAQAKVEGKIGNLLTSDTLRAVRLEELSPQEGFANLIALGVDPDLAEVMVVTEFRKRKPPAPPKAAPQEEA